MEKLYVVTMSDGSKWGVPAEIIAKNKAEYYAKNDRGTSYEEEYGAMMQWFDENDYEFADWAKNNMDWDYVKDFAVRLPGEDNDVDWQDGWVNGEYEYVTKEAGNG